MDLLDPLDTSEQEDEPSNKVIIHSALSMEEHSLGSDDADDPQVDHLSPQTLLETPQEDVQYSFRTPDGAIAYGVLKVEEESPQILAAPTNFTGTTAVPQVITSNLNGHLYVIGNASDVFVSQPSGLPRTIAPRATVVESSSGSTSLNSLKKAKRDERRRATHNEVERRRRDKINNWIMKLASIIPLSNDIKGNGHYDGQSKGGILAKACEYIMEMRDAAQKLEDQEAENKRLNEFIDVTKKNNLQLEKENKLLKEILKQNGIEVKATHIPSS